MTEHRLIDEYQIVLTPIALGKGRTIFDGLTNRLPMKRTQMRTFENGNVFLCYEPV
ncbi:MAG: dihydrofolate reductase family protein [Pyrinomonadaceae bacterium]